MNIICSVFGHIPAEVDLFALVENTHCLLFFSLVERSTLGVDSLDHHLPNMQICISTGEALVSGLVQNH